MSIGLIFFVLSSAAAQEAGTRIVGAQGIEPYPFHTHRLPERAGLQTQRGVLACPLCADCLSEERAYAKAGAGPRMAMLVPGLE